MTATKAFARSEAPDPMPADARPPVATEAWMTREECLAWRGDGSGHVWELSPPSRRDSFDNVPLFAALASVAGIVPVASEEVGARLLRRQPDGSWPADSVRIGPGAAIPLASIGLDLALADVYYATHLAAAAAQ